jgi:hypothetical protein
MKNKLINYLRFNNDEPSSILQFLKNITPSFNFNFSENIFSWEKQQKNSDLVNTIETKTIEVLKTNNQEANLTATYNPNAQEEELVFKYRLKGQNAQEWELTYGEVAIVFARREVSVQKKSKHKNLGIFSIGKYTDWLYSHNLLEQPEELENRIYSLLEFSLTGKK